MATEKQLAANRSNARRSTGPKTAVGRASSARNSLKHGMRARAIILLAGENPDEWRAVSEGYFARFAPADEHQVSLVMEMVQCSLNLDRSRRIEASLLASAEDPKGFKRLSVVWPSKKREAEPALKVARPAHVAASLERPSIADGVSAVIAEAGTSLSSEGPFHLTQMNETESATLEALCEGFTQNAQAFALVQRYRTSSENSFYRALHELERDQARKRGEAVSHTVAIEVTTNAGAAGQLLPESGQV